MPTRINQELIKNVVGEFEKQGFAKLSGLFTEREIAGWRHECDRLLNLEIVGPDNLRTPFKNPQIPFPEKIDPVIDISPVFKSLVEDQRLISLVEKIFDDQPYIFKDKLLYKLPGMKGYSMHQDYAWGWQQWAQADQLLSVSIQIDQATIDNGCIELFKGYHQSLITPAGEERNFNDTEKGQIDEAKKEAMETEEGDVLIFHSLTPHQSEANKTRHSRRSLYLTYNAKSAGDIRHKYYEYYMANIAGKAKGEFI